MQIPYKPKAEGGLQVLHRFCEDKKYICFEIAWWKSVGEKNNIGNKEKPYEMINKTASL